MSFFPTNQPLFPSQKKRTNLQRGRRGTRGRGSPLGLLCCSHLHIHRQVDAIWCLSFHLLRLVSWLGLLGLLLGYAFSVLFLVPTFSGTLLSNPIVLLSRRKRVRRKKPSNTKKPRSNLARVLLFVCHFFRTTKKKQAKTTQDRKPKKDFVKKEKTEKKRQKRKDRKEKTEKKRQKRKTEKKDRKNFCQKEKNKWAKII